MTTQVNIINDLCNYSKIPTKVLEELLNKTGLCIGSAICEAAKNKEEDRILLLNLGIGTLSVDLITMDSKFTPSKQLKKIIKQSIEKGVDPLELVLEQTLVDKLLYLCDEVI